MRNCLLAALAIASFNLVACVGGPESSTNETDSFDLLSAPVAGDDMKEMKQPAGYAGALESDLNQVKLLPAIAPEKISLTKTAPPIADDRGAVATVNEKLLPGLGGVTTAQQKGIAADPSVIIGHAPVVDAKITPSLSGSQELTKAQKTGVALDPSAAPSHPVIVDETDSPSFGGTQPLTQAQQTGAVLAPSVALSTDMAAKVAVVDECVGAYSCNGGRTVIHLHREANTCMLGEIALDPNVAKYQEITGTWRAEAATIDISFSNMLTRCTAIK